MNRFAYGVVPSARLPSCENGSRDRQFAMLPTVEMRFPPPETVGARCMRDAFLTTTRALASRPRDAAPMARSVLLHDQKADFDAQQQKPDVATRDAKLEDSLQEHPPDSIQRKRTSHLSHNTSTPKLYLTRGQPTQFWRLWKEFLLGRR